MTWLAKYRLTDDGRPVPEPDLIAFGEAMQKHHRVALDLIGDVKVSTVFLGIDHRFNGAGDPILWETMIFGGEHGGYQERYTSLDDAKAGHAKALALLAEAPHA